ncbi:hypothetical protein DAPPUDRAFT_119487 [Daphnia pulex]|uniref:Uncharacterized protein n=1 Tax=Daphnia pulex TaxID=6669 RepID=E9HYM9_DAPPU|nr:hypothetical protein DAPPUDRAFT_119487 [Daphnia pulex]|eukprot:EFX63151.1 hypothetical protein DAPPUDRAFT_119487 [Daphnia pulex]
MEGGRELRSVGPRKEKDLSPYVERRARGTRREVVLEDLKDRAGVNIRKFCSNKCYPLVLARAAAKRLANTQLSAPTVTEDYQPPNYVESPSRSPIAKNHDRSLAPSPLTYQGRGLRAVTPIGRMLRKADSRPLPQHSQLKHLCTHIEKPSVLQAILSPFQLRKAFHFRSGHFTSDPQPPDLI